MGAAGSAPATGTYDLAYESGSAPRAGGDAMAIHLIRPGTGNEEEGLSTDDASKKETKEKTAATDTAKQAAKMKELEKFAKLLHKLLLRSFGDSDGSGGDSDDDDGTQAAFASVVEGNRDYQAFLESDEFETFREDEYASALEDAVGVVNTQDTATMDVGLKALTKFVKAKLGANLHDEEDDEAKKGRSAKFKGLSGSSKTKAKISNVAGKGKGLHGSCLMGRRSPSVRSRFRASVRTRRSPCQAHPS